MHTHRGGERTGGIALCKIITMNLHSLCHGFVAIIRLEKSWIFTHTLSNYDNRHYFLPHCYLSEEAAAEARKVGWDSLQFYTPKIMLHFSFSAHPFLFPSLSSLHCFSASFLLYSFCILLFTSFFTLFFYACSVLKSIVLYEEEGWDLRVRMAPGCYRAGSRVGLIFRVRPGAFIFSHLEPLVFDVNLAQE